MPRADRRGAGPVPGLAERLSGLSVTYPTGKRVPNLALPDGSTLFEKLRTGEHVKTEVGLVRPDGHLT